MAVTSSPMRIILAGAGRVAAYLAQALQEGGHRIILVLSRTEQHARQVAETAAAPYAAFSALTVLPPADVVIYAVSDHALEEVTAALPPVGMLALHTAGSLSMEVFQDKAENYGVLYPLQTFSPGRPLDLREVPFCIEANTPENLERVRALASSLSRRVLTVSSQQRLALHLAAVLVNNFVNHLYVLAGDLLQQEKLSFDLLRPLIEETAAKVLEMEPERAQTGPAARNDENVIKKHLELLSCSPELQRLYRLLSDSIRRRTGTGQD